MSAAALVNTPQYELDDGWGRLPHGWVLGQTGIATDRQDNVYLFNRSDHPVVVLDRQGGFLRSWGEGLLTDAHGIYIDPDDCVFLAVRNSNVVLKYTSAGQLLMTLGVWDSPSDTGHTGSFFEPLLRSAGPFNRPTDAAVSPGGDIYISDGYGNARVHRFSASGVLLQSWGEPGHDGPGAFHVPHGIWVHTDGRVLVADRENNRIQVFTPDGEFLALWDGLQRPSDIFIDDEGLVYVAELDSLVAIFTLDGDLVTRWGSPTPQPGGMSGGHQIWVDSRRDLYVGHNQPGTRLLKYTRKSTTP